MKPLVLHMPDPVRDALERALAEYMPDMPESIDRSHHAELGKIIDRHLMRYEKNSDTGRFLEEFQQAFITMQDGSGNPAVLMENMPPEHGRLVMYGLGCLVDQHRITEHEILQSDVANDSTAQSAHHDFEYATVGKTGRRPIQFLHCIHPGTVRQPTVLLSADEVIDRMAEQHPTLDFEEARADIIHHLSDIQFKTKDGKTHDFLRRNPAYDPQADYAPDHRPPEFFIFTPNRFLYSSFVGKSIEIAAGDKKYYEQFDTVADRCITELAHSSNVSTKPNTLLMFNDVMALHGRGPAEKEQKQSDRVLEILMAHQETPSRDQLGYGYIPIKYADNAVKRDFDR